MKLIVKRKVKGIEGAGFYFSLTSLGVLSLVLFFSAVQVVPAAEQMIGLLNEYPEMKKDHKAIIVLIQLVGWGMISIVCGVLAQAFNKNLVSQALKGDSA